jgi:hypothetical protein
MMPAKTPLRWGQGEYHRVRLAMVAGLTLPDRNAIPYQLRSAIKAPQARPKR